MKQNKGNFFLENALIFNFLKKKKHKIKLFCCQELKSKKRGPGPPPIFSALQCEEDPGTKTLESNDIDPS